VGHVAARDKRSHLRSMAPEIYVCGPLMTRFKVWAEDLIFDDLSIVEYLTFIAIMKVADVHIYA
jgi:hypothetical protein